MSEPSSSSSSPEFTPATTADNPPIFTYKDATYAEILEDLQSRFIDNLPEEEFESIERIFFQVEQAHWYYEDFIREQSLKMPSYGLKKFSSIMFHTCDCLSHWKDNHDEYFSHWMKYKVRVPVCGAIMLNETWDKVLLVKGWKSSAGWGYPKGKINQDEQKLACAIREVLEETGYNLAGQINPDDVIAMNIRDQDVALYIVPNVSEAYPFKTKTRKEISKIEWWKLADLPGWKKNSKTAGKQGGAGRFYMILPFTPYLKAHIHDRKPRGLPRKAQKPKREPPAPSSILPPNNEQPDLSDASLPDANQESSSQSSDPHTPSPQYTQSVAHRSSVTEPDHDLATVLGSVDPHFARLMANLTLSGTATKPEMKPVLSPLSIVPNQSILEEPSIPDPLTSSSTSLDSSNVPKVSCSPSAASVSRSQTKSSSMDKPSPSSQSQLASPRSFQRSPLASKAGGSDPRDQPPVFVSPSTSAASVSAVSPRPKASRRTSSTADISPYLSKSVVAPMSAKHLQQLALLESVADESSRMTPVLRESTIVGPVPGPMFNPEPTLRYPHPPASVPPPPHNVFNGYPPYGTGMRPQGPPAPSFSAFNEPSRQPPQEPNDPFQVRPRTSQTFHRHIYATPSSMSMNQNQLLSLMNNPRASVPPQPSFHIQQPPFQVQQPPFQVHQPPFQVHPLFRDQRPPSRPSQYRTLPVLGHSGPQFPPSGLPPSGLPPSGLPSSGLPPSGLPSIFQQTPLSAPAMSPGFNVSYANPAPSATNPLLSILNGNANGFPRAPSAIRPS